MEAIEKLNNFNFAAWSDDIKALLIDKGLWSFIDGTEPKLDSTESLKDRSKYNQRKSKVYSTIYLNTAKEIEPLIKDIEDGSEAWQTLKNYFQPKSRARVVGLLDKFFNCRFEEGDSIALYAAKLRKRVIQLAEAGHPLGEMYKSFQLIRFLPADFQNACQQIYRWDDKDFTF